MPTEYDIMPVGKMKLMSNWTNGKTHEVATRGFFYSV